MGKRNENSNDKLKKWIDFDFRLDTSEMRDLDEEEEKACAKALDNMSEKLDVSLFDD